MAIRSDSLRRPSPQYRHRLRSQGGTSSSCFRSVRYNAPYDQLILSLQRISYDYTIQDPQDGSYGRKIAIALDGNNREILKVT